MLLRLNAADQRPLHEQVAAALRRTVADGEVAPGDRLPPARDLASLLGVNANTVLRALRDLRDEQLLEFRRGRGVRVAAGASRRAEVVMRVREVVHEAERGGYDRAEIVQMIEEM